LSWILLTFRPDPPVPAPVTVVATEKVVLKENNDKKAQSAKKLTLVKKDTTVQPVAIAALTSTPPAPVTKTISSPIERATELSPVIASHLPVKSPQPLAEKTTLTQTQQQESSPAQKPKLPPGLGVVNPVTRQQQQQKQLQQSRKTKQTSPVVMPVQPISVSSIPAVVPQFGSFGISKPVALAATDPIKRYVDCDLFKFLVVLTAQKRLQQILFNLIPHNQRQLLHKALGPLQLQRQQMILLQLQSLKWEVPQDYQDTISNNNLDLVELIIQCMIMTNNV
jgi:hypothetical protein